MKMHLIIRRFASTFILVSLVLAHYHSPYWLWVTAFVGFNLLQSSFTKFCPPPQLKSGYYPSSGRKVLRLTQKWCYPKPLEFGSEGSPAPEAVRPPSFSFLGGLLFIRSGAPVQLPLAAGSVRSLSSAAPLPASRRTEGSPAAPPAAAPWLPHSPRHTPAPGATASSLPHPSAPPCCRRAPCFPASSAAGNN